MDGEKFLFSLSRFGIKLGLGPTLEFSQSLGNPHKSFKSIHIAGSNGKGSTATYIYRILKRKYVAALYTSPHLRRFSERIIVGDQEIPSDFIEDFVARHNSTITYNGTETQLTFFEYTTNMAFEFFRQKGVQFASVEVGLGGRLDSTNIIDPEVSVITSISLEHADKLGGNIEYIAREKGGIIKKKRPVVIGKVPEIARKVFLDIAKQTGSRVKETRDYEIKNLNFSLTGTRFNVETDFNNYEVKLKALGEHQLNNAMSAILACESLENPPSSQDILDGLEEDQIPGRFEIRRRNPLVILDGAHNSEAARVLSSNIKRYRIKDPLIVLGVLKDKNSYNILQSLSEVSDSVLITEPNEPDRKKDVEDLKKESKLFFKEVEVEKTPIKALKLALRSKRNTIITGSLYLVGEMESLLDNIEKSEKVPVESEEGQKPTELIE
ncbi:MAG: folylpolyglutamate synthase/dihydrofolate synthase family protein [Thermoplasmatales archaeon]